MFRWCFHERISPTHEIFLIIYQKVFNRFFSRFSFIQLGLYFCFSIIILNFYQMTSFQKTLNCLIQYLALSSGRQKICRLIQYYGRFLVTKYAEHYEKFVHQRNQITDKRFKAESIMNAAGMARKILRFGPSITLIKTIISNVQSIVKGTFTESTQLIVLKTLSAFFLSWFVVLDHYTWLYKVNLAHNTYIKDKCQYLGALGWLLDCITCLIKNFVIYKDIQSSKLIESEKSKKFQGLLIDTIRLVLDTPVAYYFTFPGKINGKTAGLLGAATSLIGMYQMWPAPLEQGKK